MDYSLATPFNISSDSQEFAVSWRSTTGRALMLFMLLAVAFALAAIFGSGALRFGLGAVALVNAGLVYVIGDRFWGKGPYLHFGPIGIGGKAIKGDAITWNKVAGITLETVQGHVQLHIELTPQPGQCGKRNFLTGSNPLIKMIPLAGIEKVDQSKVLPAAHAVFMRYAPTTAATSIQASAEQTRISHEFEALLRGLTPTVWAMYAVIAICVLVWVANVASGMSAIRPEAEALFRWGGSTASAVQAGQEWRLVTAMFLHGGVIHLALNMFALWEAGHLLCRLFGNRGFLLVYFGAGIVGSALSLHFAAQTAVSVGASGAVFGVSGALLAAVIQHRGTFPVARSKELKTSLTIFIIYSLMYGFSHQGIDNAAHIGGLVAGFAVGWLLVQKIDANATNKSRRLRFIVVAMMCMLATVALVVTTPPAKRDVARYFSDIKLWQTLLSELKPKMEALDRDTAAAKEGKLSEDSFEQALVDTHLPTLRQLEGRLNQLQLPGDSMPGRLLFVQKKWVSSLIQALDAEMKYQADPTPEALELVKKKGEETKSAMKEINDLSAEAAVKNKKR